MLERKRVSALVLLMTLAIYWENVMVIKVAGAPFKPTHIIFIAAIIMALRRMKCRINKTNFYEILFFLILPILPLYRIHDVGEWFKSYVVWIIIVLYIGSAFNFWNAIFQKNRQQYIKIFVYTLVIVQILAIIQSILMNLAGIMFLAKLFGPFQFIESYISTRNGLYRAFSIFHEPSVLGWVNTTGLACVLYTKGENIFKTKFLVTFFALCIATTLVSFSASGMYFFVLIIVAYCLITSNKKASLVLLFAMCCALPILWNFTNVLAPMKRVFSEYNTVNSSGYERLNAPLQYAKLTLQNYPLLGRGIGQEGNIDAVGVIASAQASVANNSFYQMIMNFGLSSIFVMLYLFAPLIKNIRNDPLYFLIFLNLIGVFIGTGAYLSLDFLAVINVSLLFKRNNEM